MTAFKKWLVVAVFLLGGVATKSQRIFFEELTVAEGLPSDYVNCVFYDSRGFLWIATDKGACRYDGRQFLYLTKDNGLSSNFVYCFDEDREGNIWMGTLEGGLCKFDGSKVIPHFTAGNEEFSHILSIRFNADNSFFLTNESQLYYSRSENEVPRKVQNCSSFFSLVSDTTFIAGDGVNIFLLTKNKNDLSLSKLPDNDFFRISGNRLFKRKGKTLICFEINGTDLVYKKKFLLGQARLPVNETDIKQFFAPGNELFIATVSGLIYIDGNNNEYFLNAGHGMGVDYIRSIYKDRNGNIYLCTFGGGIRIWPGTYLKEFRVQGKITSVCPVGDTAYITTGSNFYVFNRPVNRLTAFPNLSGENYTAACALPSGRFCLGTMNSFYELPNAAYLRKLTPAVKSEFEVYANSGVSGFFRDDDSNKLYVATYGNGLMESVGGRFKQSFLQKKVPAIIEALVPVSDGFAALTYSFGVTLFSRRQGLKQITTKENLLSNTVYSVFQEKEHEIWIGTHSGLNLYDGERVVKTYTAANGLTGSKVLCIFRDPDKRFWVLSDKFLHLLENDRLRAIRSHPLLYDARNSINRAAYDAGNNLLYIGLTDALLTVDIKKIIPDTVVLQPGITGMWVDTSAITLKEGEKIVIPEKSRKITFEFHSVFRPLSKMAGLYYMLKGIDDDWQLPDESAKAVYQKLPPGNYELVVKTVNPDGYVLPETGILRLEVIPPFWKRTWFMVLFSSLLLLFFFATGQVISKKRYRRKLKRLQEEHSLQLERERIAMELHDNVGSQLTYLINKIEDDYPMLADKKEAGRLSGFARRAMQELRETIWALDKKEMMLHDLEYKIMQLIDRLSNENNRIRYHGTGGHSDRVSLKALQTLNIYRIIQEALNNALKYSEAETISVYVDTEGRMLNIKVTDDGKGFDAKEISRGYGLRNMRKRALEMNATIDVQSEREKGTVISLSVPGE
ncbi:MAG: hypothetical protein KIT80_06700 [Chitinophagaceae bacterium]|nr:hypothetical protein [Chitinophagaceae bacterium]MCW5926586.1 hypothetical protein [Chitinophagaceae bacterium]